MRTDGGGTDEEQESLRRLRTALEHVDHWLSRTQPDKWAVRPGSALAGLDPDQALQRLYYSQIVSAAGEYLSAACRPAVSRPLLCPWGNGKPVPPYRMQA
jgi:hypothetical protein